ncbi:MAG: hypothetical protein JSS72_03790 [Armatimonadetes bacterium]|nr:hypothetical protein [Armatimonadota bacterium]
MRKSEEPLTEEVLSVTVGRSSVAMALSLGLCFGCVGAFLPQMIFMFATLINFNLFQFGRVVYVGSFIVCSSLMMGWLGLLGWRYVGTTYQFNRDGIRVCKGETLLFEATWSGAFFLQGFPVAKLSLSDGSKIKIPLNFLLSERYEVRVLLAKLRTLPKPGGARVLEELEPDYRKLAVIGAALLAGGIAVLFGLHDSGPIFVDPDGMAINWAKIGWVSLAGSAMIAGWMLIGIFLASLGSEKHQESPLIQNEGIDFKKGKLRWEDIIGVRRSGPNDLRLTFQLRNGKTRYLDCSEYKDGEAIRDQVLGRFPPTLRLEGEWRCDLSGLYLIGGIFAFLSVALVATMLVRPSNPRLRADDVAILVFSFSMVSLLFGLIGALVPKVVAIRSGRVIWRNILGYEKSLSLAEIATVEVRGGQRKGTAFEILILRAGHKEIRIGASTPDYGDLRDAILAQTPQATRRRS